MSQVEQLIGSITEDQRSGYLWPTKSAADAVGCHPNKYSDWWSRTKGKLIALGAAMPAETAAELASIIALSIAATERRQRERSRP